MFYQPATAAMLNQASEQPCIAVFTCEAVDRFEPFDYEACERIADGVHFDIDVVMIRMLNDSLSNLHHQPMCKKTQHALVSDITDSMYGGV